MLWFVYQFLTRDGMGFNSPTFIQDIVLSPWNNEHHFVLFEDIPTATHSPNGELSGV